MTLILNIGSIIFMALLFRYAKGSGPQSAGKATTAA